MDRELNVQTNCASICVSCCVLFSIDVQETVQSRKDVRTKERSELAQGIMPETLKNWKVR